jgi:hypothetical protein
MAPKKIPEPTVSDETEADMEIDDEDMDGDYEEEEMNFDLGSALEPFLATEDGQTVCTALVTIAKHMEMQNKILVKMLTKLSKE